MIRLALMLVALAALLAFPWPVAFVALALLAWFLPLGALALGVLMDALYYTHGVGLPVTALFGGAAALAALLARRFFYGRADTHHA